MASAGTSAEALKAKIRQHTEAGFHYGMANALRADGELEQALDAYRHAVAVRPDHAEALHNMAETLHALGRSEEAEVTRRQALEFGADRASDAWFDMGLLYERRGRYEDAAAALRRAVEVRPDHVEALVWLGDVLRLTGRLDEARDAYGRAAALGPEQTHAGLRTYDLAQEYIRQAEALTAQGRIEDALVSWRCAIAARPRLMEAYDGLVRGLRALDRTAEAAGVEVERGRLLAAMPARQDEAMAAFQRALEIRPDLPAAHGGLGHGLWVVGRLDEAREILERAVTLWPDRADGYFDLGQVLQSQGLPDQAEACFRQAMAMAPDLPEVHHRLGQVLHDRNRLDEAATALERALVLDPVRYAAAVDLSRVRLAQGRPDEAEAILRRTLDLARSRFRSPAILHLALGALFQAQGRTGDAVAAYETVLGQTVANPALLDELSNRFLAVGQPDKAALALTQLATVRRRHQHFDHALAACHRALVLQPGLVEAYLGLGNALHGLGRLDEAVAAYRHALAIDPAVPEAHRSLGEALQALGHTAEAAEAMQRALEGDCW